MTRGAWGRGVGWGVARGKTVWGSGDLLRLTVCAHCCRDGLALSTSCIVGCKTVSPTDTLEGPQQWPLCEVTQMLIQGR